MTKRGYHATLLDYIRDLERVGDHVENIIELIDYRISNRVALSERIGDHAVNIAEGVLGVRHQH
jgi:phosphate:Na+ symporter